MVAQEVLEESAADLRNNFILSVWQTINNSISLPPAGLGKY
jgi:hypothetical protein